MFVVPKTYYPISEVDPKIPEVMLTTQKNPIILEKNIHCDGITIIKWLFKDVVHYHLHIISCFNGDVFRGMNQK